MTEPDARPGPNPRCLPCGDTAVCVEFGDTIDPLVNARVLALDRRLADLDLPGVVETVPTYRSLLVHYDPVETGFSDLSERLLEASRDLPAEVASGRVWRIPVVYGGAFGADLTDTAVRLEISEEELIARHSAPTYRVYMIGFLPGFAYLGGLDPALAVPRREVPRERTPAGTISIGGGQAAVASIEAPSGWHLLGRTPVRNFMADRDPAFILAPGDGVRFEPVPAERWDELDRAAAAGAFVAEVVG